MNNAIHNATNPHQGSAKKVLCVCSAGLLRSPTAAVVINRKYDYNTRAAGVEESFALIPVSHALLRWADEVICMTDEHALRIRGLLGKYGETTEVFSLGIPDSFAYMDKKLVQLITERYAALQNE